MSMLETAEIVAARYGIDRAAQDAYSVESQRRTAAAQEAGRFDAEIVPISTTKRIVDRETGDVSFDRSPSPPTSAIGPGPPSTASLRSSR